MQVGLMTNPAQPAVDEITWAARHGFTVVDVREAPDRPGKELVVLARRAADR